MSAKLMGKLANYHRRLVLQGGRKPFDRLLLFGLLPWALLYGLIGWVRGRAYDLGLLASYRAPIKVISVGNITVGGTGKTPVVDWLAKRLAERGIRPAIVSRGYAGNFAGPVGIVSAGQGLLMTASEAGDEPCLLARSNPAIPVIIASNRAAGVRAAVDRFGVEMVILDDAFQHRAVQRDVDLVLLDGAHPLGNGLPLPAGLLREFPGALKRADLLLLTRATAKPVRLPIAGPVWTSQHQPADYLLELRGERVPLARIAGRRILAFAGIADPESFFSGLAGVGIKAEKTLSLPDHARYDADLLRRLNAAAEGMEILLTTEKDGVKLAAEMFAAPCYQLPMCIHIDDEAQFFEELFRHVWRS